MKIIAVLLAASIGVASAAPAIVWKSGSSSTGPSHISDAIDTRSLLSSSIGNNERDSSALAAVVFLVGRHPDGSEGLASLASSGKLPAVQEKYGHADEIHHHVQGVESTRTVARDARFGDARVAEVSMEEFQRKLSKLAQTEVEGEVEGEKVSKTEQKRRRAISEADVLVVNVRANDDAAKIDSAIVAAIDSSVVRNVVLSTIRSTHEVKHARKLATRSKFTKSQRAAANGRRLEDEADNENNDQDDQEQGLYYVNMTPNIFAGLLFFFMFTMTAYIGLTCMNMIEGQDVYVKKLPHIGREA
mmetsp:Transcript_35536/g.64034  ORF Transcript_35536/g.64034 Transcript_35536/m.64034 type:complete len:302 (-) Transcript_35536:36-941(-)|eukprot:CAMPEP_0201870668 /NCGR_PEP_ID=MMETSP0902-20130614/3737_1 /ASSEMBLY_ACC=CAM_ASM_000551 /TAXON_ID=420261 /ORGANISM="Thalassiosira antarctica, Strain CCMP982" /LENGTH=301 /DNA_ID=CAMNT_0048396379 /DNA_START=44 /DNA_END=949 /DNA_ORIENTATION=+